MTVVGQFFSMRCTEQGRGIAGVLRNSHQDIDTLLIDKLVQGLIKIFPGNKIKLLFKIGKHLIDLFLF